MSVVTRLSDCCFKFTFRLPVRFPAAILISCLLYLPGSWVFAEDATKKVQLGEASLTSGIAGEDDPIFFHLQNGIINFVVCHFWIVFFD